MCRTPRAPCLSTVRVVAAYLGCSIVLTSLCSLLRLKESVVLYVAHNNPTAAKVYHRVGFVGLSEDEEPVEGVDSWLELGFDQEKVELGHW